MRASWRKHIRGVRPGLTLIELLVAIIFFGLMGALLLPRLAPVKGQEPAAAPDSIADGACLPSYDPPAGPGAWTSGRREAYVGIGAVLDLEPTEDGYVRIHRPFADTPAEGAGIEPGDVIQEVDGTSVRNETVERVAAMIRDGQIGTPVQLTLAREGWDQPIAVTVIRQCIHPPSPFAPMAQ